MSDVPMEGDASDGQAKGPDGWEDSRCSESTLSGAAGSLRRTWLSVPSVNGAASEAACMSFGGVRWLLAP